MEKLFGTDGIRAKSGRWPLTPDFVLRLGQIAGIVMSDDNVNTVVIGRDTRASSIVIQSAIMAGLLDAGVHVIDLGVMPTPAISWAVRQLKADAGVVISASHNPADENGIKFFGKGGKKFPEKLETEIETMLLDSSFTPPSHATPGRLFDGSSLHENYIRDLVNEHAGFSVRNIKLVVDCANGAASHLAADIFTRCGVEAVSINSTPNGLNINKNAGSEFVRRNVDKFTDLIKGFNADFGVAFDGDADRVIFVDEMGRLVDGDHVLGILARHLDDDNKLLKRSVVTTVMRNNGLKNYLVERQIEVYETPVGDKYVTEQLSNLMKDIPEDSQVVGLGGEQSGHIILLDARHVTGDGIRTALHVLDAFCKSGAASLAELSENIGKTPQVVASAYVGGGPRLTSAQVEALINELKEKHPAIQRSNLRYSGTEPLFRVMLEGARTLSIQDLAVIAHGLCKQAQATAQCEGSIDILNSTYGGVVRLDGDS